MALAQCSWCVGIKAAVGDRDSKRRGHSPSLVQTLPCSALFMGMNFMSDLMIVSFEHFVHDEK